MGRLTVLRGQLYSCRIHPARAEVGDDELAWKQAYRRLETHPTCAGFARAQEVGGGASARCALPPGCRRSGAYYFPVTSLSYDIGLLLLVSQYRTRLSTMTRKLGKALLRENPPVDTGATVVWVNPLDPEMQQSFDAEAGSSASQPTSSPTRARAVDAPVTDVVSRKVGRGALDLYEERDEAGGVGFKGKDDTTLKQEQQMRAYLQQREGLSQTMASSRVLHPMGAFRKRWDAVQVVLLFYIALATPFRIGFGQDAEPWEAGFIWELALDAFFWVDIIVNFRTAYYGPLASGRAGMDDDGGANQTGEELVYHPRMIFRHYIRGWFGIDFVSCLPINYIILLADIDADSARSNKMFRLIRLIRLVKLLRLLRLGRLLKKYRELFEAFLVSLKLGQMGLQLTLCAHWLGCLWYYLGTMEWHADGQLQSSGQPIMPWVERYFGGNASDTTVDTRYVTALYWSMMTITSVGYGDIHSQTLSEKCVAIFGMMLGGFTFGLVIGRMSELSRRSNPAKRAQTRRLGELTDYMHHRGTVCSVHAYYYHAAMVMMTMMTMMTTMTMIMMATDRDGHAARVNHLLH
jgi:hypothetical protein